MYLSIARFSLGPVHTRPTTIASARVHVHSGNRSRIYIKCIFVSGSTVHMSPELSEVNVQGHGNSKLLYVAYIVGVACRQLASWIL